MSKVMLVLDQPPMRLHACEQNKWAGQEAHAAERRAGCSARQPQATRPL